MDKLLYTLEQFMFTPSNLKTFLKREDKAEEKAEEKINIIQKPQNLFIPKYKDTLFWCFYIMIKGWEEFLSHWEKRFFLLKKIIKYHVLNGCEMQKNFSKKIDGEGMN